MFLTFVICRGRMPIGFITTHSISAYQS